MNKCVTFLFFIFLTHFNLASAQQLDMAYFSKLPIQHDGRIKPMESFARHLNTRLSHPPVLKNIDANTFLASAFFNPADTTVINLFEIRNRTVKSILNLDEDIVYFSLSDVIPALQLKRELLQTLFEKNAQTWSKEEQDLVSLYNNAALLKSVITSLHILLPLKIDLPEDVRNQLNIPLEDTENYLVFQKHEERFRDYIQTVSKDDTSEALKAFLFQLTVIEQNTDPQNLVRIMPPEWPMNTTEEWYSPWIAIQTGLSGPESAQYLNLWQNMALAYRTKNAEKWLSSTKQAFENVSELPSESFSPDKLGLEVSYLNLSPYFYGMLFYALSCVFGLMIMARPSLPLLLPASLTLLTGVLFHALALTMRIIILERPPVSTLYESVIFVSLICCALAFLLTVLIKEKALFIFLGSLCGIIFYFVGLVFAREGDTLQVLTAVLDTSFWLATHVIIITAGYGFCVLTALLAHYYLFAKALSFKISPYIYTITFRLTLVSLLFTSIGTILGGIWADQSWGRFWGWDPKENGALLIVLWLVWSIHGKIAGQLKEFGFMIATSCLGIIVALAWFGVNLLNVGLHSYGFVSGIAYGLLAFCIIEAILIAVPSIVIARKFRHET